MPYIGVSPPSAALTSSDITDSIITADKLASNAVTEAKMADDAISLTELKAGTDGEVISWDASGNPVAIGAGTSGHFLKSQGAGSQPVFAAGGGDIVKVGAGSVTSGDPTAVAIDGYFDDTTYYFYKLFAMFQITDGSSDTNPHLLQRINIGGTSQTSSAYDWVAANQTWSSGSASVANLGANNAAFVRAMTTNNFTQADASDGNAYNICEYEFYKPQSTADNKTWKFTTSFTAYHSAGAFFNEFSGAGSYASTSAYTGVTFYFENGAGFEKAYWSLYGYKF